MKFRKIYRWTCLVLSLGMVILQGAKFGICAALLCFSAICWFAVWAGMEMED